MKRRGVWQALLLLAALMTLSCGPEPEGVLPEAAVKATHSAELRFRPIHQALVLSTRPEGEASSREAQAAAAAGLGIHMVTPSQWSTMTAAQFQGYRALIIGDEVCAEGGSSALQAAIDTRHIWGPVVSGNIFVVASDPSTNRTPVLVERGVGFALAREDATGLYVSLGCAYQGAAPGTSLELLEPFGAFTVAGVGCHTAAHSFVTSPKELTSGLYGTDERLTGDQCAVRTVFTHYPEQTFAPVALAVDSAGSMPGAQPYPDPFWDDSRGGVFAGTPYILARGARPRPPGSPPVARCRNLDLEADRTCGASGSIDDGSSDPDGDLVSCEQSPEGPYRLGTTTVTLTCMDSTLQTSSCTATVRVRDVTTPQLALVGAATQQAECGTSYTDPGAAADDFCDGDLTSRITRSGSVDVGTPGSYGLTYDVADSSGNRAPTARRTVNVSDTQAPEVTVLGPLNILVECGDSNYVDPGASATDVCAGSLPVRPSGAMDIGTPGTYSIHYSATDPSGNIGVSARTRTVTVIDTTPPLLNLNGPHDESWECGTPYNDPVTATDVCFGDLTDRIVRSGEVDPGEPDIYVVTYSVTDPVGHSATQSRRVTVRDTVPPAIRVLGPLEDSHQCGSAYVDPGATANDRCSGAVPVIAIRTSTRDQPGSFTITYSAVDESGNSVTSPDVRQVTVTDHEAPVLTLLGATPHVWECSSTSYVDPGAVATDQCFGDLTRRIVRTGSVNSGAPGTYPLTYNVRDPSGNSAVPVNRTVNVVDTRPPVISSGLPSSHSVECTRSATYVDPGLISATDSCAGPVPVRRSGTVNMGQPGAYSLTYTASDPSGNSNSITRTVTVSDSLAPTLSVYTTAPVECGAPFSDPVVATDQCFGDLTNSIVRTGDVNPNVPGTYPVSYSVTDPAGHSSPQANTTIRVHDTVRPTLVLIGPANMTIRRGTEFVDPGASAHDQCAGELPVTRTGEVDTNVPGTYQLTYRAVDPSGNVTSGNRWVTVVETQ
jgi:hypothetical protein